MKRNIVLALFGFGWLVTVVVGVWYFKTKKTKLQQDNAQLNAQYAELNKKFDAHQSRQALLGRLLQSDPNRGFSACDHEEPFPPWELILKSTGGPVEFFHLWALWSPDCMRMVFNILASDLAAQRYDTGGFWVYDANNKQSKRLAKEEFYPKNWLMNTIIIGDRDVFDMLKYTDKEAAQKSRFVLFDVVNGSSITLPNEEVQQALQFYSSLTKSQ